MDDERLLTTADIWLMLGIWAVVMILLTLAVCTAAARGRHRRCRRCRGRLVPSLLDEHGIAHDDAADDWHPPEVHRD